MSRHVTTMTIHDAEHYTPAQREAIIAAYPAHERDARAKGIPIMGSGLVFPVPEESITVEPRDIPAHWAQINGLDFGIDHPFAAVNVAIDRDADCIYVTKTYREKGAVPAIHAAAIKPWGHWIPCAWPHDGLQRDKLSGQPLAEHYKSHGLNMLAENAKFADGSTGVEAGIMEMYERMLTNRFKVFKGLNDWFEEMRLYHREEGQIVKLRDDLISATRYAVMTKRFAETAPSAEETVRATNHGSGAWMAA